MATKSVTASSIEGPEIEKPEHENQETSTPHHAVVIASDLPQISVDFDPDDPDNPRNWAPKKKVALASFVLLSAFVA